MNRSYAVALACAVIGGAIALMASLATWATVSYRQAEDFPAVTTAFTGGEVAGTGAAGGVGLACAVALIAGGRILRALAGVIALGCAVVLASGAARWISDPSAVVDGLVAGRFGGVDTSTVSIVDRNAAWPALVLVAAAGLAVSGVLAILRGGSWPRMSSRYQREPARAPGPSESPGGGASDAPPVDEPAPSVSAADLWKAQNRGEDPTA